MQSRVTPAGKRIPLKLSMSNHEMFGITLYPISTAASSIRHIWTSAVCQAENGSQRVGKVADIYPDFVETVASVPDGIRWLRPYQNRAPEAHVTLHVCSTTVLPILPSLRSCVYNLSNTPMQL